jgi:hypothetical protein
MRKNNYLCLAAAFCIALTLTSGADAKSFLDTIDETVSAVNSGLNVNNSVTTTVSGAGNVVTQITDDTIVTIENGKKTVTRIGGNSYNSAASGVSKTADNISSQVNNTINKANSAIDKMNADLNRAFGDLNKAVGGVNDGLKKASGDVKTVTTTTVDKAGNAVTNTVNSVNSGVTRISESNQVITINNGAATVSGRINETVNSISGGAATVGSRVNETVEAAGAGASNVSGRINEMIGSVNNAINPMANPNANQPVNTPVNQINLNNVTGNPESIYSEKALEGMALLGDRWARLKLDEIRARKMADIMHNQYKSISWFNIFKKLDAYSSYKNAKNHYIATAEQVRRYELANPNSGGIVQGIDQISESVLEFKALFGDKKAQAQLEVLRARREYEKIKLQYDSAGLFEKLKYRGRLQYAKTRYEEALKAFEIINRSAAGTRIVNDSSASNNNITTVNNSNNINTVTNTVTTVNNNTQTTIVQDNVVTDKNGGFVIESNDDPSIYVNNASLASAKAKMDAAYKNYIDYMSLPNPSQSKLEQLYKEYVKAIEVFQNVAHSK